MIVLGIETSCDETSAAIVADGRRVFSSVVSSQFDLHRSHGGVVPELAARCHVTSIIPVVQEAIAEAGIERDDIDAIAVTQGPGLAGSLVVGVNAAKAMARVNTAPLTDLLPAIPIHVDVVGGSQDAFCPRKAADLLMAGLVDATYWELEGLGHLMNVDDPAAVTEVIEAILKEQQP